MYDFRIFGLTILALLLTFCGMSQHMVQVERSQYFKETVPVHDVLVDNNNKIWVATSDGLYRFGYYEKVKTIIPERKMNALAMDGKGEVWVGSENGTISNGLSKEEFEVSSEINITSMVAKDSVLWIATEGDGIYVYDLSRLKKIAHHTSSNSKLLTNSINFVQFDQFGVIWAGTQKGICRIEGDDWKIYEKGDNVTAVARYEEDIWFLGNSKLWKVEPDNRWARIRLDQRLTDGVVKDMAFDNEGRLYMASNIFTRYDIIEDTLAVYDKSLGFVSDQSIAVTSDQNNNMWVGTMRNGLFRFRLYFKEPEPEEVDFSAICYSEKELDCAGDSDGALGIRVTGGRAPYYFDWDCDGCRGPIVKGLPVGVYSVTVTDSSDKTKVLSTAIIGPDPVTVQVLEKKDLTKGGSRDGAIKVDASGGNGDYKFVWENGTKGADRKRLEVGDYSVTATDSKGCTASTTIELLGPKIIPELEIAVLETGQTITMEQLYFSADSLNFKETSLPVLNEVYTFLKTNNNVVIEIGGHTNSLPAKDYCDWLSTGRAKTVAEFFYRKGIPKSQVSFKGYGKENPIATNSTKSGRNRNQRVEIKVLSIK